jgi:hypothetical protein
VDCIQSIRALLTVVRLHKGGTPDESFTPVFVSRRQRLKVNSALLARASSLEECWESPRTRLQSKQDFRKSSNSTGPTHRKWGSC